MRRFYILVTFIIWFAKPAVSQTLRVLNSETRLPVPGAIIYNENLSLYAESDDHGLVALDSFSKDDTLFIQHPSYHLYRFPKGQFGAGKHTIYLNEKTIRIDEVIISANRWEEKKSEIPFEIMSLDVGKMAFNNVQTVADALESTGQVFVQKSQLGGGSPMIRGFGANSVLIVVDGVRMNNAIFRGGNLQNIINIDPNSLESSEVIFGPGAVIYGSDALGGIMDFHTAKPRFSADDKLSVHGTAMLRYSTANREQTGSILLSAGKRKWAYLGSISYSDFDDLCTGAFRTSAHPDYGKRPEYVLRVDGKDSIFQNNNVNLQRFSGYNQINTLQKIALRINDESELSYTFNYSNTGNIPRYDRLIYYEDGLPVDAEWYYGPQKWMMNALKYTSYRNLGFFSAMKLTIAFQNFEESRHDRRFQRAVLRNRFEKVNVFSFNADMEKELNSLSSIFYGAEYINNFVNSTAWSQNVDTGEISDLSTRYPDGGSTVNVLAAYLSMKHQLKNALFLNGGIRYTHQFLSAKFSGNQFNFNNIDQDNKAVNGNVGLVWKSRPSFQLSGLLSSGFRAPNIDDISKVFDSEPGSVVVPNPGLQPEYSYNAEISVRKIFTDKIELTGTVFYSFLQNAMVRGDFNLNGEDSIIYDGELSKVQAIVNTGKANIFGFSAGMKVEFSSAWSALGHINITEGRDIVNHEPLRHTTPVFGIASVVYKKARLKSEAFVRFNGSRSFDNLPPSEQAKAYLYTSDGSLPWYTVNFRAEYAVNKMLMANVALENLLDHHYRTYSSGISAPGRNLILSLRLRL